jgi:hypothetical protein
MCLEIDDARTEKIRKKLEKKGSLVMYKVVNLRNNQLLPMYFASYGFRYKSGWIYSNRTSNKLTDIEIRWEEVNYGIHVFYSKRQAKRYLRLRKKYYDNENHDEVSLIVIPVTVSKNDFIAAGNLGDVVFTKVFLQKEDYYAATMPA